MSDEKRYRIHYMILGMAEPGMVLGAPLVLQEHGVIRFNLPVGHILTEANLEQMRTRHAEIVCVLEEDTRTESEREADWAREEERVRRVFALADMQQALVRNLRQAVLRYRRQ